MAQRQGKRAGRSEGYHTAKKVKGKKAKYNPLHNRSLPAPERAGRIGEAVTPAGRGRPETYVDFPPAAKDAEHVGRLPLGPDEMERLRELLHRRRKNALNLASRASTAESDLEAARRITPELAERGTDRAMEMLLIHEEAKELAEVNEIEAALKRMRSGSYGICVACGERIPYRRLLALPEAQRCIRCEKAREAPFR